MLQKTDPQIDELIKKDYDRQNLKLQLIPSENFTSSAVREAVGSVVMHKYSEGQVGKRYYEGNQVIDQIEALCKDRALEAFGLEKKDWHANVQAHAGSIANLAVYNALLQPNDKIMGMYLFDGGHLSHGWKYKEKPISISSKIYEPVYYHVDPKTGMFDYEVIEKKAHKLKPKILISGGTAYPREIDHKKMAQIAKDVGAYYLADIAHEAGLIAAGGNGSPFPHADIVTMTTHKTLRGPKGSIIICRNEFADDIDRSVFPGIQGGPMNHSIAGIAVALAEAQTQEFQTYAQQVIQNAQVLGEQLLDYDFELLSEGTDKHLILIDLQNKKITGRYASWALDYVGITTNMNTIPSEPRSPFNPSGLRIGTPTITTRGMKEPEMRKIARLIHKTIELTTEFTDLEFVMFKKKLTKIDTLKKIREEVEDLCKQFPLPL